MHRFMVQLVELHKDSVALGRKRFYVTLITNLINSKIIF